MNAKKTSIWFLPIFLISAALFLSPSRSAQEAAKKLTYDQVYRNAEPRLLQPLADTRGWLDATHYLLFERDETTKSEKLFRVDARSGEKTLFLDYSAIQKDFPEGLRASSHVARTEDFQRFCYLHRGDLYSYSVPDRAFKRLTASAGLERNPRFSPDGRWLAYTRNHNLYSMDIERGLEHQLTDDGSDTVYNGWASWVYYEEILGRRSRYAAFWWSPDSRRIAFLRFDDSPVPTFPLFRAGGPHGKLEIERYPKAGDPNPYVRLGVVPAEGGKIVWADVEEKADHYVAWPFWLADGRGLTFQWMNRDQDHIIIYRMDLETGEKSPILEEKQPSWVTFFEDLHFFGDGSGLLLRTDADGWSHLYHYGLDGRLKSRLTQGEWSVTRIALVDEAHGRVFFHARKGNTTETHLFRVNLDGSGLKRLTRKPGTHRAQVSPDGSYILDRFSSIDTPARLELLDGGGTLIRRISDSRTPVMAEYALGKKELFTIPTEDGWELPAYWILPPEFDPGKRYPVLFMIYGGPGSSTVSNSYPSLSQLYLVQEGIIVFSLDHRGSGH
ncbi:MAG: S9 family peptidase, partial [Candidatus Aminicenantales bacterium]